MKKQATLSDQLKELQTIVDWFEAQETPNVEEGIANVKKGVELIKSSKTKLKSIQNEFEEIQKELDDQPDGD